MASNFTACTTSSPLRTTGMRSCSLCIPWFAAVVRMERTNCEFLSQAHRVGHKCMRLRRDVEVLEPKGLRGLVVSDLRRGANAVRDLCSERTRNCLTLAPLRTGGVK